MEEQEVFTLVQKALGEAALSAACMTDGQQSEVWDVALPEREIIVRLHADPRHFAGTQRSLEVLAELGLPVPRVLASDLTCTRFPLAFVILTKIPGRDLRHELASMTEPQMSRLAEQIAGYQTRVAALPPGTGYGYAGIGERGPHLSWWNVVLEQSEWNVTQDNSNQTIQTSVWQDRLNRFISEFEPYLRQVPPTCFLDDITVKNVLVKQGELQGLVDFDCVCYGDPLFWLGLTAAGVVSDVGTRELFYVRELCRFLNLSDEQLRIVRLYAAWVALGFVLRYSSQETTAWSARMLSMIELWVTQ